MFTQLVTYIDKVVVGIAVCFCVPDTSRAHLQTSAFLFAKYNVDNVLVSLEF